LAAEAVKRGQVYRAEWVQALADLGVRRAVHHQAGDAAQFQEALAEGCKRGVDVADHGISVVALEDMHGAGILICAVFVNQGAGLGTGGRDDGGDQRLEFGERCGLYFKGKQTGNIRVHAGFPSGAPGGAC